MPVFVQCLQQVAILDLAIAACTALLLSFRLDRKHWDTFLLVQHHGLAETRARRSLLGGQRESVRIRDLSRLPKTGETATTDLSALRACTMIAHLPRLLAQKLHEAAVKSRQTARLSFPFQFMWFSPL